MSADHRRRGGHGVDHEEEGGMERWLLTYADMITLLLALFVVLFAMSSINMKKFLEFKLGLTQTFSPSAITNPGGNGLLNQTSLTQTGTPSATKIAAPQSPTSAPGTQPSPAAVQLERIASSVQKALATKHLQQAASVTVSAKGVVVQVLADKAFFASGSAALGVVGDKVVDTIAGVVRNQPNNLVVEGYTDNVPIVGGPFRSNWALSAVRAANVADRLAVHDRISPNRVSAQGYGKTHPVDTNATATGRAENRRIDVVVLSTAAAPTNGT